MPEKTARRVWDELPVGSVIQVLMLGDGRDVRAEKRLRIKVSPTQARIASGPAGWHAVGTVFQTTHSYLTRGQRIVVLYNPEEDRNGDSTP